MVLPDCYDADGVAAAVSEADQSVAVVQLELAAVAAAAVDQLPAVVVAAEIGQHLVQVEIGQASNEENHVDPGTFEDVHVAACAVVVFVVSAASSLSSLAVVPETGPLQQGSCSVLDHLES